MVPVKLSSIIFVITQMEPRIVTIQALGPALNPFHLGLSTTQITVPFTLTVIRHIQSSWPLDVSFVPCSVRLSIHPSLHPCAYAT